MFQSSAEVREAGPAVRYECRDRAAASLFHPGRALDFGKAPRTLVLIVQRGCESCVFGDDKVGDKLLCGEKGVSGGVGGEEIRNVRHSSQLMLLFFHNNSYESISKFQYR